MKKILSLLLCYVFLQAETFALRGGPGGGIGQRFAGTYAGTMIPDPNDPKNDFTVIGSNLGLFLINVPPTGPAIGSAVIFDFNIGGSFAGTINGIADPDTGTLTGVFQANASIGYQSVNSSLSSATIVTKYTIDFTMSGTLKLTAVKGGKSTSPQRVSGNGVSTIAVSSGVGQPNLGANYTNFKFDGFQQSGSSTGLGTSFSTFSAGGATGG